MKKWLINAVLIGIILCGLPVWLYAEQTVSVAVFPFSVQAPSAQKSLGTDLPLMLGKRLENEGTQVVYVKEFMETQTWDVARFRQEGIRLGVDYIITGNVFMAGNAISIDANMHPIYETGPPLPFFSQSGSLEELHAAIGQLSRAIIGELFEKRIISTISVTGNRRVDSDAILRIISTNPGDIMNPEKLSKDLEQVYKMGFFDDVVIEKKDLDQGIEIVFNVTEKPSVRNIKFSQNRVYKEDELAAVVDTSTGSILNVYKINSDVEKIKRLYMEKNYHNCTVTYEITPLKNNQADIVFVIDEGEKIRIESIVFEGNTHFKDKKLKKTIQTREKGFWSFITSSGDLDESELTNDVLRIESLYKNNGFINVKLSDPQIDMGEESIAIYFKIDEGEQYKTGNVDITGDILTSKNDLFDKLLVKESDLYNRELIRKDMLGLSDLYSNQGYANVKVSPLVETDDASHQVHITYKIDQGEPVYFNRILISGNEKTRDKVIRREMAVEEQGKFSMSGIQRSYRNLSYRDYFQSVEINPVQTDVPNQRDLEVKVEEKPTGNFSFGGGFSTDDGPFGQVSLEERNLFGRGQNLKILGRISGETGLYDLGFTEPWIFDMPVSAGFNIYKLEREFEYYERNAIGLTLRSAYRQLWDYTTIGVEINFEDFEVEQAEKMYTNVTEGNFFTASIKPYISYDSRNHYFLPTEGVFSKVSAQYAGEFMGGDIDYTRYVAEGGFWMPLFWKFTGGFHMEGGYLDDRTNGQIDIDWERFYLGGINSVRGFDKYDINTREPGQTILRGGEKYIQFNAELIFPLQEEQGVAGVLFYDRGDVYRTSESIDLAKQYSSAGFELRWNSPMGPIRLAYGIVVEGQDEYQTGDGQFDFSIGAFF
ncbi:outer membrane protein assembly factor BamA [Desulfotignum phosphitoxidans]|uniref:Outer membrane protein assembly factor BamA n=1 Tax=Desulfotignum phosphitoxidans DSM 13687 TaxID=1286635 RepID=S0G1N5_9BACT|nr:outer membrane protein assembly factor BamA [Desulfotignum phosphitoxidans]EMS79389.1 beta-barrel assembly machine subunit BamA [Desulfotignum phosphitoxidans DSM 13687]